MNSLLAVFQKYWSRPDHPPSRHRPSSVRRGASGQVVYQSRIFDIAPFVKLSDQKPMFAKPCGHWPATTIPKRSFGLSRKNPGIEYGGQLSSADAFWRLALLARIV